MITIEAEGCIKGHYCSKEVCKCKDQREANVKIKQLRRKFLSKDRAVRRLLVLQTLLTFNDMFETTSEVELWDL